MVMSITTMQMTQSHSMMLKLTQTTDLMQQLTLGMSLMTTHGPSQKLTMIQPPCLIFDAIAQHAFADY